MQFDCPEDTTLDFFGPPMFYATDPSNFPSLDVTDWANERDEFTILVESEGTERYYSKEEANETRRPTIQLTSSLEVRSSFENESFFISISCRHQQKYISSNH